jgi:hypothetical protein
MSCTPTSTISTLTKAQIESLGFTLLKDTGDRQVYKYQQFTLIYTISSRKIEVYYGHLDRPMDYSFVSIVDSLSELRKYLQKNNVI